MRTPPAVVLSIPEPCSVSWEAMTPDGPGRYCASCCKTVVDLTDWDDAALAAFFEATQNKPVCGRLRASQLHRPVALPHPPHSTLYQWVAAAGITAMTLTAASAAAQAPVSPIPLVADSSRQRPVPVTGHPLSGAVYDKAGEPVFRATIQIQRGGIPIDSTETDLDGRFRLQPAPHLDVSDPNLRLVVTAPSYTRQAIQLAGNRFSITLHPPLQPLPNPHEVFVNGGIRRYAAPSRFRQLADSARRR